MNRITYEERKRIYEHAIDRYGIKPQLLMVIEEMSELTKEICKSFRGMDNIEQLADEAADVTIMLEQLRLIFGLNDLICEHMDAKIERLAERLDVEVAYGNDL